MIEHAILSGLVFDDQYTRTVLPYLKRDYFKQVGDQVVFTLIKTHVQKYNSCPTVASLKIDLDNAKLVEKAHQPASQLLDQLKQQPVNRDWLIDSTEQFCKKTALYNAIAKSAELVVDAENNEYGNVLELVRDALSVSFNSEIGHDYLEDAEERFLYNTRKEHKLSCSLETFNRVLRGGFVEKSLTLFLLPTGVGKSLIMCQFSADFLRLGYNVLYITLEMPEKQVGQRIDANLLDIGMTELPRTDHSTFMGKINSLKKHTVGKLVIQEYPPHSAHSGHFRHLINELKLKKNFTPDVIMVDYMGICGSAVAEKGANSYTRQKCVAEELRGLGMEFNCRVFSGAQVNKEGTKAGDFSLTETAESWAIPQTADYMFGGISTEELERLGQLKIKRLKDRHNAPEPSSFLIGLDRAKMRLYDIDQTESEPEDDKPVFDSSPFSELITQ